MNTGSGRTESRDAAANEGHQRLVSLDVLRGLTVMGMVLVNSMAHLKFGAKVGVFPLLVHSPWAGLTIADLVFPAFIVMLGVAIPLSLQKVKAAGGLTGAVALRIFGRTLRLFAVGLALANVEWVFDAGQPTWAFWDVLQRIALVYAAASVLFLTCRPRTLALIAGAVLVLYWPLTLLPSLDETPNDLWQRGHSFVSSLDRATLGEHRLVKGPEGYDPEGLLSTLPAIAQALLGVLVGLAFLERRDRRLTGRLAFGAALMLALGIGWGFFFPVVKDIWSSSFVLVTTGITLLALAGLHRWLDARPPFTGLKAALINVPTSFGLNAIAAFVLHELTAGVLGWQVMLDLVHRAAPVVSEPVAALFPAAIFIFFAWLVVDALRRRGTVLTI